MIPLLFFSPTVFARDSDYNIQYPCDCDISDKCDLYCCCDLDCNSSSITKFNSQFCIPESQESVYSIRCDTNNVIKSTRGITTRTINNINCYYVKKNFTSRDEITNYAASYFGLSSYTEYAQPPTVPYLAEIKFYETDPFMRPNTSVDILYAPIGINSIYCNALYAVRNSELGFSYNTSCVYDSLIVSNNDFTSLLPARFCNSTDCQNKTTGMKLTVTQQGFNISNASVANQFEFYLPSITAAPSIQEVGNGYGSGKPIIAFLNETEGTFTEFLFNGESVTLCANVTTFFDVSSAPNFSSIFPYPTIYPTYGNINGQKESTNFTLPEFGELNESSIHIYTILYKKYGNALAYYYKIVGVTYTNLTDTNNNYAIIKINQMEVSDTDEYVPPTEQTLYSATLSNIYSFMFVEASQVITTTSILLVIIVSIIVWLDYLFHE